MKIKVFTIYPLNCPPTGSQLKRGKKERSRPKPLRSPLPAPLSPDNQQKPPPSRRKMPTPSTTPSPNIVTCTPLSQLTSQLTRSRRTPSRRTLTLINKALSYLIPFESAGARPSSSAERSELLTLLNAHRLVLAPYLDTDRIEWHLKTIVT